MCRIRLQMSRPPIKPQSVATAARSPRWYLRIARRKHDVDHGAKHQDAEDSDDVYQEKDQGFHGRHTPIQDHCNAGGTAAASLRSRESPEIVHQRSVGSRDCDGARHRKSIPAGPLTSVAETQLSHFWPGGTDFALLHPFGCSGTTERIQDFIGRGTMGIQCCFGTSLPFSGGNSIVPVVTSAAR